MDDGHKVNSMAEEIAELDNSIEILKTNLDLANGIVGVLRDMLQSDDEFSGIVGRLDRYLDRVAARPPAIKPGGKWLDLAAENIRLRDDLNSLQSATRRERISYQGKIEELERELAELRKTAGPRSVGN